MQDILRTLVELPTVTGEYAANHAAFDYLHDFLEARGMHVERKEYDGVESLLATTRPTKTPAVILNAHVDVVPGLKQQYALTEKDGKLFGRGTFDMKAGLAAYLQLVDDLQGTLGRYDFGLMVTSDEETGGYHGVLKLVEDGYVPTKICIIPDGGDDWRLETFAKGIWFLRIVTTGTSAHGSRPWEGDSALEKLLVVLEAVRSLFPAADKEPTTSTMTIGLLQAGETINKIPDRASAALDIRTGSVAEHFEKLAAIQALCQEHGAAVEIIAQGLPCANDPHNPYIRQFADAIESVIGRPADTTVSYAGSDGRHFSAVGVPCVIVRPTGGGHHGPDEWIDKKGFEQFLQVLHRYIEATARTAQPEKAAPVDKALPSR